MVVLSPCACPDNTKMSTGTQTLTATCYRSPPSISSSPLWSWAWHWPCSQSMLAQTCATTVFACCSRTHRSNGGRRGRIRAGPKWYWILYRVWGSWTGGIHSTPPHLTHRRLAPLALTTAEYHIKNPAVASSHPQTQIWYCMILQNHGLRSVTRFLLHIDVIVRRWRKPTLTALRWDANPTFQCQNQTCHMRVHYSTGHTLNIIVLPALALDGNHVLQNCPVWI